MVTFALIVAVLGWAPVSAEQLDERPVSSGGDPQGIWAADSLDIDVYATPTLRAAVSDLDLTGFVDGQISFQENGAYRFEYVLDIDVSLTFLGGPVTVVLRDTVSESGSYAVHDTTVVLTRPGVVDTLAYTADTDTLRLIQEVPLGEFATLAASIDPDGGPPLSVLKLARVVGGAVSADFDGDGSVGFPDFLLFAGAFGLRSGDAGFDSRFDLDADGEVGFSDFLLFVSLFG